MYVGVDIGGSKILVAASDDGVTVTRKAKVETPPTGAQGIIEIIHLIEQVAAGEPIRAIGVASAGPLDLAEGLILPPAANMHGWSDTALAAPLRNHFRVPVVLQTDAVAAAIAEAAEGAGREQPFVLYVTISTGIGVSLIADGEPYTGTAGLEAGHIIIDPNGPVCGCGGRGHFEALCSGKAIKRRFGKYGYQITDPKTWDRIAADMAVGFNNLIVTYSPSVIVVGGGVGGVHYGKYHPALMKHLTKLKPPIPVPPIVQARFVETAVIQGALLLASRLPAAKESARLAYA